MFTIKKIWNALNHAGKPWQIAMAIALGMIVGFTPLGSLHNIVILLLVLILNIHFGIFILALSLFSTLGFILDPLFGFVGHSILTSGGLNSLFTAWYNDPFMQLTSFNNTILMGSLVLSLVLFFPIFKVISIILVKYRELMATKIANIPLLNKLDYFKNEEISEVKTFRLIGIGLVVILVSVVSSYIVLFLDNTIKTNIEKVVNKNSNKLIKIGSLSTSFTNSSVSLKDLRIEDKKDKANNIDIKNVKVDIDLGELIFKRVIIQNIAIDTLSFPNMAKLKEQKEQKVSPAKQTTSPTSSLKDSLDFSSLQNLDINQIQDGFNGKFQKQFEEYKGYYNQIKPLFNKEKEEIKNRLDGRFVHYKYTSTLPDVLIKRGEFSIVKDDNLIKGDFKDFTTNQYLYKKPFVLTVNTKTKQFDNLFVNCFILETKEKQVDTINVKIKGLKLDDTIKKDLSVKNTLLDTNMKISISNREKLNGSGKIDIVTTDIAFNNSNKYVQILNKSLVAIKGINGTVLITGDLDSPKLKLNSNLDRILKVKIEELIDSQKDVLKKKIKQKVKARVDKEVKKVKEKINKKVNEEIKNKIGDKLGDKLGDKVGDQVEDKIKGLLGF
jgi:uncharacterized protein (TIGR03546 family)